MSGGADVAKNVFINGEGELRSGWRVLVFFFIFQVFALILSSLLMVAGLFNPSQIADPGAAADYRGLTQFGLSRAILLAAALAASALCARLLERRSFASIGYKLHRGWLRDFALGSALGAVTLAFAVAMPAAAGAVTLASQPHSASSILIAFAALSIFFLIAGAFEEVILRGFPFQALAHNMGALFAVAVTAIIFGLLHLQNPNVTLFSTVNTMLAGVWLGVAYLATRSLWLATALHYSWNLAMVFIFGLPVSGITMYEQWALWDGQLHAPAELSGGDYGPEGGAAATIALILSTIAVCKSGLFKPSAEMIEETKHGSRLNKEQSPRA